MVEASTRMLAIGYLPFAVCTTQIFCSIQPKAKSQKPVAEQRIFKKM